MYKVPTGIEGLDLAIGGGLPMGSFILLNGEAGTGKREFAYTVAANCSAMKSDPTLLPAGTDLILPERIWYVTIMRSKEWVLSDIRGMFSDEFYERFTRGTSFKEFFPPSHRLKEFKDSIFKTLGEPMDPERLDKILLKPLGEFLEADCPNSLTIFHAFTDIVRIFIKDEFGFLAFVQSLREMCHKSNVLILSILDSGIFPEDLENNLVSIIDGTLTFGVMKGKENIVRRNVVYCRKIRGLSPNPEPFEIKFTPAGMDLVRVRTLRY